MSKISHSMELKDFVADALFQIMKGVKDAASREGMVGTVSPAFKVRPVDSSAPEAAKRRDVDWEKYIQEIEFDIAVTITDKLTGGGKAGAQILSVINLGAEGTTSRENIIVNKIKFAVPVIYPANVLEIDPQG